MLESVKIIGRFTVIYVRSQPIPLVTSSGLLSSVSDSITMPKGGREELYPNKMKKIGKKREEREELG